MEKNGVKGDYDELQLKFQNLYKRAKSLGLTSEQLSKLDTLHLLKAPVTQKYSLLKTLTDLLSKKNIVRCFVTVMSVILTVCVVFALNWPVSRETLVRSWYNLYDMDSKFEPCMFEISDSIQDLARPPVDCSMCAGIEEIDRVSHLSPETFESRYAYSGRPVVVQDGMKNWTAPQYFSYQFFKNIYGNIDLAPHDGDNCQFFPYKSKFRNLHEVFNMSAERAALKKGTEPWYVGWNNCDSGVVGLLREHYQKPYFLPKVAESSRIDWIFMGSPGYGAHMHIDNVGNPSWQAQVTGTKLWTLEPPPECYLSCAHTIKVVVNPGEIIVLDTNSWYHSTLIIGDEMSIVIGSEYD